MELVITDKLWNYAFLLLTFRNYGFKIGVQGKRKVYTKGKEVRSGEALRRIMGTADPFGLGADRVPNGVYPQIFCLRQKTADERCDGNEDCSNRDPKRDF